MLQLRVIPDDLVVPPGATSVNIDVPLVVQAPQLNEIESPQAHTPLITVNNTGSSTVHQQKPIPNLVPTKDMMEVTGNAGPKRTIIKAIRCR